MNFEAMKAALKDFAGELDGHVARKLTPSTYKVKIGKALHTGKKILPYDQDERLQKLIEK